MADRRRVLVAVLVYGGPEVTWPCLESVARVTGGGHDVDVLVLDDCSPEPGFSDELAVRAAKLGLQRYRSPRNLGVPRNMNLGLLRAREGGYDAVVLLNSDTIVPATLVDRLLAVLDADPHIGSVTPWSNNATLFSLPLGDGEELADQRAVDDLDAALAGAFGPQTLEVPTGVGFCLAIPTRAVRDVGLMDPVFGRGYCEEVDWCQRARAAGYRNVLAFGSFVYHRGGASNRPAGLLAGPSTTVLDHERLVELRYPGYHDSLAAYDEHPELEAARRRGLEVAAAVALGRRGYELEVTALPVGAAEARLVLHPSSGAVAAWVNGQTVPIAAAWGEPLAHVVERFGRPRAVTIRDRGPVAEAAARWAEAQGVPVRELAVYPTRI